MKKDFAFSVIMMGMLLLFQCFQLRPSITTFHRSINDSIILISGQAFDQSWHKSRERIAAEWIGSRKPMPDLFMIQLFSGNRSEATKLQRAMQDTLGIDRVMLFYDEPNFKVGIGMYPIRIEAEHELMIWRESYPQAFVVQAPCLPAGR